MLQGQFGFDDGEFLRQLRARGFVTNPSSHSNFPYTSMSLASTMSADYLGDIVRTFGKASRQTVVPYHRTVREAPVVQALKGIGYRYELLGNWYETSNRSPLADKNHQEDGWLTVLGHALMLDNFARIELKQSWCWRVVSHGLCLGHLALLTYASQQGGDAIRYQLDVLHELAGMPPGGRMVFAHLLVPHEPYYYNADGSRSRFPSNDNYGEPIKKKYLRQVEFIEREIVSVIDAIDRTSHGQAVVVLQSDEGAYPVSLNHEVFDEGAVAERLDGEDMRGWSDADLRMKYGALAAYRIPAARKEALAAADHVNVFRVIFNTYFGAALPYRASCVYGLPSGRENPIAYADVTLRVTGSKNPACASDGSGPRPGP